VLGLAATLYKVAMSWAIRHPIRRAIRAATTSEPSRRQRWPADYWQWPLIVLALAVFVGPTIEFRFGRGSSATSASAATQVIVVALAVAWLACHKLIAHLFAADRETEAAAGTGPGLALRRARFSHAVLYLFDSLLVISGAA